MLLYLVVRAVMNFADLFVALLYLSNCRQAVANTSSNKSNSKSSVVGSEVKTVICKAYAPSKGRPCRASAIAGTEGRLTHTHQTQGEVIVKDPLSGIPYKESKLE